MKSYKWETESIDLESVVVLRSEKSANIFFENIYPHWPEPVVVSADGIFPKDQKLKDFSMEKLRTDEKLPVILFGGDLKKTLNIISNKIFYMDEFLKSDLYRFYPGEAAFNWTERGIARFCFHWSRMNRIDDRKSFNDQRNTFNPESCKWYINMLYE